MTQTQPQPTSAAVQDDDPIIEVVGLKKYFPVKSSGLVRRTVAHVQAVDGISFTVPRGGSLGLVGESGCGKSTTGRLLTRLYDVTEGQINFEAATSRSSRTRRCCRCAARSR